MEDILIVGASGHAKLVIDAVEKEGRHSISGLLSRGLPKGASSYGYPVLGREEDLPALARERQIRAAIVAIGDNWLRSRAVERIQDLVPGFGFVTVVHPSAQLARGVRVGEGSAILASAVVNPDSVVGDFCILGAGSSLDHDSLLGEYASLGPGATTGGNVSIGRFSAVCLGANVIHGVAIGENTVVGAGATVLSDLPDHVVSYGTPARIIRKREPGDKYL